MSTPFWYWGLIIGDVVRKAEHAGELLVGLRIEIGVAEAAIDRPVPDAEIGQATGIVGPDRNISRHVDHVVVDACVPTQ